MIEILECPICKHQNLQRYTHCQDYTVSHETFQIRQCVNCTLAITTPRPETSKLGGYYNSVEYISHSGKSSGGIGFIYRLARWFALNWKRSKIREFKKHGSILDFGCGTGEFLKVMLALKWSVTGIEPTNEARFKAEKLTAQKVFSSLDEITTQQFDVITAWHVFEHVPGLIETISKLKSLLKKDGILFIAVPNYQSPDATFYKHQWAGFDVPRHLWHFSKKSMSALLDSVGLKLIDTVPMKLDAYYVSMLSEKYKNKNIVSLKGLLNGFTAGLKSNLKAKKEINHSSLIYIAKVHEG